MTARPSTAFWISAASFAMALTAVVSLTVMATRRVANDMEMARLAVVRDMIADDYVEPVENDVLWQHAIRGMVEGLDDYSRYYVDREAKAVEQETRGSFGGIGLVTEPFATARIRVVFPQPGSPAERAGLRTGMEIVAVDGVPIAKIPIDEITERIRGDVGTELVLSVGGGDSDAPRDVRLKREAIRDRSVRQVRIVDAAAGIGAMHIGIFTEETPVEFDEAVGHLRALGMRSLILDLRLNGGGVLDSASKIANRFLNRGVIYEMRGRKEQHRVDAAADLATMAGVPLVVLVTRESASASEVLAGALRDHGAAAIIGERTYGKGVVQSLKRFEDNGAYIKITTAYYYTPSGRNLGKPREDDPNDSRAGGIFPDVALAYAHDERVALSRSFLALDIPIEYARDVENLRARDGAATAPAATDRGIAAAAALLRGEAPRDRRIGS